ncbi:hypothetical protein ABE527_02555 [Brucella sp. TWI432]
MTDAPSSYFVFDPGRSMGFAYCLAGGEKLRHGTWRFTQPAPGEAFATFASYLRRLLQDLPDPLVAMELATIVSHGDDNRIDAKQVIFSAGWPSIAQTVCHTMNLREPEMVAIQTWRSKTHGKTRVPDAMKHAKQNDKSKWFKEQARQYCNQQGWSYNTADEAEALCILDAVRIIHEPEYAFDKGRSYKQEGLL